MTPVAAYRVDELEVCIYPSPVELAAAAAEQAAAAIARAVEQRGVANAMFATGNSQLAFVAQLVATPGVPWDDVVVFHMDEYVGIDPAHPAGFARWIRQRLVEPTRPRAAHLIDALAEPTAECARYAGLLADHPLDLCCLGIGENGHLAFNDPGVARFDDPVDVKVVELDADCRRQQVSEGHFPTVDDVPAQAVTVTVPALLRATTVVAVVPEARKAEPVRRALEGPVGPDCPASALRRSAGATLYLDTDSAALLGPPASH